MRADAMAQLVPVHFGKHDIKDVQIVFVCSIQLQGIRAVCGDVDLEALFLQGVAYEIGDGLLVVYQ